jgi:hypothetical protein
VSRVCIPALLSAYDVRAAATNTTTAAVSSCASSSCASSSCASSSCASSSCASSSYHRFEAVKTTDTLTTHLCKLCVGICFFLGQYTSVRGHS